MVIHHQHTSAQMIKEASVRIESIRTATQKKRDSQYLWQNLQWCALSGRKALHLEHHRTCRPACASSKSALCTITPI
jgi:hypothetical protein